MDFTNELHTSMGPEMSQKPICIDELSKEELIEEIQKGISDVDNGNVKNSEEVDLLLKEQLGI